MQEAETNGCVGCEECSERCGCGECCEEVWREQMEREEIEMVVRANGIRFALNQHICED